MEFKKYFEDLSKNRLVLNFLVTIILAVIEEIMELEFTCVPYPYNIAYFVIFLLFPAGIFFLLNWIVQRYILNSIDVKKDNGWSIVRQSISPPCMWIVIVLLDGRYLQCAISTDHDASKKPTNVEMSALSKMIGLGLFLLITAVMTISYCVKKPQESNPGLNESDNLGHQPSSLCNQSVVSEPRAPEEQPGDEGEVVPDPSDLGTVSREEEKAQVNQEKGEEMERAGCGAEERLSSGDEDMLLPPDPQVQRMESAGQPDSSGGECPSGEGLLLDTSVFCSNTLHGSKKNSAPECLLPLMDI